MIEWFERVKISIFVITQRAIVQQWQRFCHFRYHSSLRKESRGRLGVRRMQMGRMAQRQPDTLPSTHPRELLGPQPQQREGLQGFLGFPWLKGKHVGK